MFHRTYTIKCKYCNIDTCPNRFGTAKRLFRVAPRKQNKQEWIDAISAHQQYPTNINCFQICSMHFEDDCFRNGSFELKPDSVPTLFNVTADERPDHVAKRNQQNTSTDIEQVTVKNEESYLHTDDNEYIFRAKRNKPNDSEDIDPVVVKIEENFSCNVDDLVTEDIKIERHESSQSQICFICNESSEFYSRNLCKTKSTHSETRIYDFIKKWLREKTASRRIGASDDDCVCLNCLDKINEYDLMCETSKRINKELSDTFLRTESILKTRNQQKINESHKIPFKKRSQQNSLVLDPSTGEFVKCNESSEAVEIDETESDDKCNVKSIDDGSDGKIDMEKIRYVYYCKLCNQDLSSPDMLKTHEHPASNFKLVVQKNGVRILDVHKHSKKEFKKNSSQKNRSQPKPKRVIGFQKDLSISKTTNLQNNDQSLEIPCKKRSKPSSLVLDPFTGEFVENSEDIKSTENDQFESEDGGIDDKLDDPKDEDIEQIRYMYYCKICNRKLSSPEMLKKHGKVHPPSQYELVAEKNGVRVGKRPKQRGKKKSQINKIPQEPKRIFDCETQEVAQINCPKCPMQLYAQEDYEEHLSSHTLQINPFRCDQCAHDLDDEQSLTEHVEMHKGKEQFQCVYCLRIQKHRIAIRLHMQACHQPKVYLCQYCGVNCKSSGFSQHMIEQHTENKEEYECEVCGYTCCTKNRLREHIKIHSAVKIPCNICGKRFSSLSLRQHLRTHDKTLAVKLYNNPCAVCNKNFQRPHLLRTHMSKEHDVMD